MVRTLALAFALFLSAASLAQPPVLAVRGGSYPGTLQIEVSKGRLGSFAVVLLSVNSGPTPIAAVCPGDPRVLRIGSESLHLSFQGPYLPPALAYRSAPMAVPNDPGFQGATIYWQAFSSQSGGCFVGPISNGTATRFHRAGSFMDRRVNLNKGRSFHSTILLPDQRLMVIGGGQGGILAQIAEKTTEIYDPVTDTWVNGPLLNAEHSLHTTTRLQDGRWLIAGGVDIQNKPQTTVEFFDPTKMSFTLGPSMLYKRFGHDAVRLPDGRVFVTGGISKMNVSGGNLLAPLLSTLKETEIYDPATNRWTRGPDMTVPRAGHRMVLLPTGKYLIYGGIGWVTIPIIGKIPTIFRDCDLYDPKTNKITPTGKMSTPHAIAPFVDLGGGKILVSGGVSQVLTAGKPTDVAEIYDTATGTWSNTGKLNRARGLHWGFDIGGGRYLHIGGGRQHDSQAQRPADHRDLRQGHRQVDLRTQAEHRARGLRIHRHYQRPDLRDFGRHRAQRDQHGHHRVVLPVIPPALPGPARQRRITSFSTASSAIASKSMRIEAPRPSR